jgi:hypothetical protein
MSAEGISVVVGRLGMTADRYNLRMSLDGRDGAYTAAPVSCPSIPELGRPMAVLANLDEITAAAASWLAPRLDGGRLKTELSRSRPNA